MRLCELGELVGKPVTDFLSKLRIVQPSLAAFSFVQYAPEPNLSERLRNALTLEETSLKDQATQVCHGSGIPFWDALLGICMRRDAVPERFLDSAGAHGFGKNAVRYDVPSGEMSTEYIRGIISGLPEGYGLVASSKVLLKNADIAHIPMLDFRCPCSVGNEQAVRKLLTLMGQTCGILVSSGRSYHYYGAGLLSAPAWTEFMGRALLFAPIVDPRYIGHRLTDGECRLKIVSSNQAAIPEIIDVYAV